MLCVPLWLLGLLVGLLLVVALALCVGFALLGRLGMTLRDQRRHPPRANGQP